MKKILKLTLLFTFSLITTNQIWGNLYFESIPLSIIKTAFILSIFEIILKPILKIILFPINLITLGLFRIVIDTLGLYLAVFLFSDFKLNSIHTLATNWWGIPIPAFNFVNFFTYLVTSVTIGLILNFFNFIIRKKSTK
jgi:putative membrane protein